MSELQKNHAFHFRSEHRRMKKVVSLFQLLCAVNGSNGYALSRFSCLQKSVVVLYLNDIFEQSIFCETDLMGLLNS